MRTTLSHVQFENEQLRTEVARLKQESRSMEDRLAQEQIHNGDLAARLDDARNLLRDRGVDWDTKLSTRTRPPGVSDLDEETRPARTLPAGRTTRKPRKPPTASIPGHLEDLPTARDDDPTSNDTISFRSSGSLRPRLASDRSASSLDDEHYNWQPVARGIAAPVPRRR
jgi:hypothetical protein